MFRWRRRVRSRSGGPFPIRNNSTNVPSQVIFPEKEIAIEIKVGQSRALQPESYLFEGNISGTADSLSAATDILKVSHPSCHLKIGHHAWRRRREGRPVLLRVAAECASAGIAELLVVSVRNFKIRLE